MREFGERLLAEIERLSDYVFVAQSLLPHFSAGDHDQWITYAQQLVAGTMENFITLQLGSSEDFVTMLASILGTLSSAVGNLRHIADV